MRSSWVWALFGAWLLVLAGFAYWALSRTGDPLCSAVSDRYALECAAALPAATEVTPGTLLGADGTPQGTLASACTLPGARGAWPVDVAPPERGAGIDANYTSLQGGGLAAIPGPAGALARASGGRDVHEVLLGADALRRASLAKGDACLLMERCASRLQSGELGLVTETLSANVAYVLRGTDAPRESTLRLPGARVIGLRTLAADDVATWSACDSPSPRTHTGQAEAYVTASGRRGAFAPARARQAFGAVAIVSGQGNEVSDCDPAVGRERSRGYAQALVAATPDGGLRLSGEVRASSGRYRFGRCGAPGRRLPTNNTLVTKVRAGVAITGELSLALRASADHTLEVTWSELPDGTRLTVIAPTGATLWANDAPGSEGEHRLEVRGPGVFTIRPTFTLDLRRDGESGVTSRSFDGTVNALAWVAGGEAAARAATTREGDQ